jgi:hypothetical protein
MASVLAPGVLPASSTYSTNVEAGMLGELIQYLGAHPGVMAAIVITALLAVVGLWYVVSHHLQAIMITLLTAAGIGSGLLVLYRGFRTDMRDLMGIGLFLVIVFPIIFWQAIKMMEPMAPEQRTTRRPTPSRAFFKKRMT